MDFFFYADKLIVDTGSAVTWIGAKRKYLKTRTSVNLSQRVRIHYNAGTMSGYEYNDTVTLGDGLVTSQQAIGVVSSSSKPPNLFGMDGLLGLGPVGLTRGDLVNAPTTTIPTVTRNLYTMGTIPEEVISIFFLPTI